MFPSRANRLTATSRRFIRPLSVTCATLLGFSASASAVTNTWTGTTDALWETSTNWDQGAKPLLTDDALFPATIPATGGTITLGTGETALSLTFRQTYTLQGGDLTLGAAGLVTVAPTFTATINSQLIGTNGLTLAASNGLAGADAQAGGGTLVLGGLNTYSGVTNINSGVLSISDTANLGDGSATNNVSLNGGTLRSTGASVDLGSSRTVDVTADSTVDVGGTNTLTISGVLNSAVDQDLMKIGTGTLALTGTTANTTSGLLNVTQGTVLLNKTGVNAIGTGGMRIASSTSGAAVVRLAGSNQIDDLAPITFNASGGNISLFDLAGFSETVGAVSIASATNGSATITTGASGVLTLNGNLLLNNIRGATGNTQREVLITGTGTYGTSTLTGTLDLGGVARTITVTGVSFAKADATIETVVRNGGIVKEGSHALLLRNNNTYAGGTAINNGQVVAFTTNSLGTGTIDIAAAGELALNNTTFAPDLNLNGGALSGASGNASDFTGTVTVSADSKILLRDYATVLDPTATARNLTISGVLTGAGSLAVSAPAAATLALQNDNSGFTGQFTVGSNAVLEVSNSGALGAAGAGSDTVISSGGALSLRGGVNIAAEALTIAGNGVGSGALRNLSSSNTFGGTVTLTGDTTIQSDAGTLTLSNPASISGTATNLTVRGGSDVTIAGSVALGGGTFTKLDSGTLTFTSNLASIPVTNFGGGTLGFTGPQSFGAVTVPVGLAYRFNSDPGSGVSITIPDGARLIAGYAADQALVSRITTNSAGVLALRFDDANPLNFTAHPDLSLGAAGTNLVTYSGTLTPGAAGYRLGGGLGRLIVNTLLSGNNALEINGDVRLSGTNTFTGPITVNSGGQLAILDNTNLGNSANVLTLNGGTIQVNEVTPSSGALYFQFGNPLDNGQARTIVVGAAGGRIDVPATGGGGGAVALTGVNSLQGAAGATLTKSELGVLYVFDTNSFAGNLVIAPNGYVVDLRGRGALPNISSATVGVGGFLNIDNANRIGSRQFDSTANDNRFNDAATVNLEGGRLQYLARNTSLSGTSSREIFGTVNIGQGQSEIRAERSGGGGSDLVITDLTRSYGDGTVRFTGGNTLGTGGDNGRVRILGVNGDATEPAAGAFLGGWALYNSDNFATYLPSAIGATGGVVRYGFGSGAPAYDTTIASGNVANISGLLTLDSGDSSTLALRMSQSATQDLLFPDATSTLYIESGGLLSDGQNQARHIGSSTVRGNLTAGVIGATAPQELFLHNNSNTLTIYSNVIDNPGGGSVRVVKDLDGSVTLDSGANTFSGGLLVLRGTVGVNRTGGLGTGAALVKNASLNLGAPGASTGTNVAADAPVIVAIDNSAITLTAGSANSTSAYTAPGDRYYISAGSSIYANSPGAGFGFNSLTRVTSFTGGGQIVLEPDAIVQHNTTSAANQGTGVLTINNLGTDADLYFGVGNTTVATTTLTVGSGTPWKGISTDRGSRSWTEGTIFANSDFYLQGLTRDGGQSTLGLGSTNAGIYTIVNNAGKPIDAFIQGTVQFNDDDGVVLPGDLTFVVMPGSLLQPNRTASLGIGSTTASVVVQAGGTLDPGGYVGVNTSGPLYGLQSSPLISPLNGSVTVRAGGRFLLNDSSGIGSAPAGSYLVKRDGILEFGNNAAFRGSGDLALGGTTDTGLITPGQFTFDPGAIVRFTVGDVVGFKPFVLDQPNGGQLVYEVVNGNRRLTGQSSLLIQPAFGTPTAAPEDFPIGNGGVLTNDSVDRQVDGGGGGHIILGNGAALAGTTQTILTVNASVAVDAGATVMIGAPGSIDGNYKLGAVQFNEATNIVMGAGAAFRVLDGATLILSNLNVLPNNGNLELPAAVTSIASGVSTLPGIGSSLWLNQNGIEGIAKLTGEGRVFTNQSSATLEVGSGLALGDDFTFAGEFSNAAGASPNLSKTGDSTLFITGPASGNTSTGLMTAYGGRITLKDSGSVHFTANLGAGGTIVLDNSGTALDDRLSGGNISVAGGDFLLIGNGTAAVKETVGQLNSTQFPGGIGHFNVQPGAAATTLTFNTIQEYQNGERRASFVFRGAGMSGQPGNYDTAGVYTPNATNPTNGLITANNPNLSNRGSVNLTGNLITGAAGTAVVATRADIMGSTNANSAYGDRLVTQDDSASGFRLLADSEYSPVILADYTTGAANVKLSGNAEVNGDTRVGTLTFASGATTLSLNGAQATSNTSSRLFLYVPAIVAEAGASATISGEGNYLDRGNSSPYYFHTLGNLTLNVGVIGSNGFVKNGPGTLTFGPGALSLNNSAQGGAYGGSFWGGTQTINGGKVVMNDATTFLRGQNNFNAPHLVLNEGTLDINGYAQVYNRLDSASPLPDTGGTITSATATTFSSYGGGTFSGHLTGALGYTKTYNTTQTFTAESTYTRPTVVNGGTLILSDNAKLTNSSSITLKYGTLTLDDTNRNATANRVRSDINISSLGGTFDLRGRGNGVTSQQLATAPGTAFNLLGRDTTIRLDAGAAGSTNLTIGNMTRGDEATTLLFTTGYGTFGYPGPNKQDLHVFFNLNGSAPTLTNDIIGGWAVVNSAFASYYPAAGVGEVGDTASGFAATVGGSPTTWNATANAAFTGNPSANLGNVELNSMRMLDNGSNATVTFNTGGSLKLTSGGLITNENRTVTFGSTSTRGTITSGSPYLYAWIFQNTTTLNSIIADDGGNSIGLIKLAPASLTLTAPNTYTGDTYAYQGTLNLSTSGANGTTIVAVPGDLYAVGGNVTESAANQIAVTAKITVGGGSTLTLRGGTAKFSSFTLLNEGGATANNRPIITATNAGGTVNLTATAAVTAVDNALFSTPTLSVNLGTINFLGTAGTAQTISVTGDQAEPLNLVFNPNIGTIPTGVVGGGLVKLGEGMMALGGTAANQFGVSASGPATEVLNIQEGIVRVDAANALGNRFAITTVQPGTVLLGRNISASSTAGIAGSILLKEGATLGVTEGSSTFGDATTDASSLGTMTVEGDIDLYTTDYFLPVTQSYTVTINSKLTGSGDINVIAPTGPTAIGVLRLGNNITGAATGANDYSGTITLGRNAQLLSQATASATTGSELGTATIALNGGELRIRDEGTGSNQTLTYGNNITLQSSSTINVDRFSATTNNLIAFGTLTVATGVQDLTVTGGNNYDVGFALIDGPGTFRKEGTGNLYLDGYAPTFSGNFEIPGAQGLSTQPSQGLNFNAGTNDLNSLVVAGNYYPLAGKAVNVGTLTVSRDTEITNGLNGVSIGSNGGSISIANGAVLTATTLRNDGLIGTTGTNGASITATSIKGTGFYTTLGQQLTVNGSLNDATGVFKVAGGTTANDVVTLNATSSAVTGGVDVQSGTLRITDANAGFTPLGGNITVRGYPASTPGLNQQAVAAPGGTLLFDTTAAGNTLQHMGNISNSGTVRAAGVGTTEITGRINGSAVSYVPGLLEGRISTGTLDVSATRPGNPGNFGIKLEPRMAQTNLVTQNALTGWQDNVTWVYTGEFYDADGLFSFIENIDDRTLISIDGTNVLVNNSSSQVTSTAYSVGQSGSTANQAGANSGTPTRDFGMGAKGDGWHTIEIRMTNGTGGAGPTAANGFAANYGLGLNPEGVSALDGSLYLRPIDPGDGSLFRTATGGKGKVVVDPGALLKVGGFSLMSNVTINGGSTVESALQITGTGTSDTDTLTVTNLGAVEISAAHNLQTQNLSVAALGEFYKAGAGTLTVTGTAGVSLASTALLTIAEGKVVVSGTSAPTDSASAQIYVDGADTALIVNGSIAGKVNVGQIDGGGRLAGLGSVGEIDVNSGILSPGDPMGDMLGALSTEILTLNSSATLELQLGGTSVGSYDQLAVSTQVNLDGELQLSLAPGFTLAKDDLFTIVVNNGTNAVSPVGFGFSNAQMDSTYSNDFPTVFDTSGNAWLLSLTGEGGQFNVSGGNDVMLMAAVPEPSALINLSFGLAGLLGLQRFRRRTLRSVRP